MFKAKQGSCALIIAAVTVAFAAPVSAQRLTPQQRARLEGDVAAQRSITRDLEDRARALDRAYHAARGIDRVIGNTVRVVPGGRAAYRGGRITGNIINQARQRRR